MVRARISSKGQITVPIEVRRRYRLQAGDEIAFRMDEGGPRIVPLHRRRLIELAGILPATRPYPGRAAIRKEVGRKLMEALDRKIGRR